MILCDQSLLHLWELPDIFFKPVIFAPTALFKYFFQWAIGILTDNFGAASLFSDLQLGLHFDLVSELG